MKFQAQKIASLLKVRLLEGSSDVEVFGAFTDSRKPLKEGVFFALSGENFDGDSFAEAALISGASMAVVRNWKGGKVPEGKAVIEVSDTLLALQKIAEVWRSQLQIPVVCITGSNGKTSTKDFTRAVLSQGFCVNATQGNLNNHIGLPLSVLATEEKHGAAIFEIGMNHAGELAPLCEIARPQFGIITNIGTAHIEFLGSREAIAEEKGTLARFLPDDGFLFTPDDCDFKEHFRSQTRAQFLPVGSSHSEVRAEKIFLQPDGTSFDLVIQGATQQSVFIPVLGKHMVTNALLAAALGWKLGLSMAQIAQGLASVQLSSGRLRRLEYNGIILLDDTYNANPESMQAALTTLSQIEIPAGAKRIAILGKMGELGDHSQAAHCQIGKMALEKGICLIAVGAGCEALAEAASAPHFLKIHLAVDWLLENAQSGDVLLFKGSRSANIEKVLQTAFPSAC